jgi:peptide/nickel transport system substrate-binding protein
MQKALAVGLSLLCFKMALLNRGLGAVAWGGAAWPTVSVAIGYRSTSSLKLALRGPDVEAKTLKVGVPFLFTNQPPDPATGGGFQLIQYGLGETLFRLGQDLRPAPWLATGARQLDERTWRITVRQGVKFHNGSLMEAAAVKASLERAMAMSPAAKARLDIAWIDVNDPSTLALTTTHPNPILPGLLTDPASVIVDAAAAEAMGGAFTAKPVLTGPFKVEEFQQDQELVAAHHAGHWGPAPSLTRVIFRYLPDSQSRVLALQSGDIDIAVYIAPESVPTVQKAPHLAVVSAAPVALDFMYCNHRRAPWQDARVRQAVALAIDREALVKAVMQGEGVAATGPFPPVLLRCPPLRGQPFDPAQARRLLAQAGYQDNDGDGLVEKDGKTLAMLLLTYRQRPELAPMAEVIQARLKAVGVKVDIRMVEQINAALQRADWDGGMYFNNMVTTGDPHWALSEFFATEGAANFGGYSSPRIDDLSPAHSATAPFSTAPRQRSQTPAS